jgi:hypothetical protein
MKLIHKFLCIALFTASCDVELTVQLGGTLRLAQIMMILVGMGAVARVIQDGRILWPRGASAFAIWVIWQGLCIPVAGSFDIAVQFYVLLLFTAFGYISMVQLYGESDMVESLLRAYLWSFIAVAGFGAVQLVGPLLFHVIVPFTQQWLVYGRVPRISAFSYEPSYFATYMFLGYATLVDLRISRAKILASRPLRWGTGLVVAVLILSSSKTAWLCILLDAAVRLAPRFGRGVRTFASGLRAGYLVLPLPRRRTIVYAALSIVVALVLAVGAIMILPDPYILLSGTGLAGTAAHSYVNRNDAVFATLNIVLKSPLIGRSMGGVPVAIAAQGGIVVTTVAQARDHWGFPVLLDVFAGSGLFGFIPFALFLWANTFGAYRLARTYMPLEAAKWLRAVARASILEWVLLLGDQNLFRVYLWCHIGMVTLLMYYLEFGRFHTQSARLARAVGEGAAGDEGDALGVPA